MRWRWPPENSRAGTGRPTVREDRTRSSNSTTSPSHLAAVKRLIDDQRLGDDLADPHARVERAKRVLEHRLNRSAVLAPPRRIELLQVAPLEPHLPTRRLLEPQHELRRRRLATAGLADDAQRATRLDGERNPVDRAHHTWPAPNNPRLVEKCLVSPSASMIGISPFARQPVACRHPAQPATRQLPIAHSGRPARPPSRQRSKTCGQRSAKAQPRVNLARSAAGLAIAVRRWLRSRMRGIELSRAFV
jgi:hypothetical protein